MKILTVVGARPQFIKAAPVSKALRSAGHREYLVHTGQHYDYGMSQVFFDELQIPQPALNQMLIWVSVLALTRSFGDSGYRADAHRLGRGDVRAEARLGTGLR